jgi:hypothetical protein
MTYSADYLIQRRRAKWEELHSIEHDKKLRKAMAEELIKSEQLRLEVKKYPEKLIELFFVVVDKNLVEFIGNRNLFLFNGSFFNRPAKALKKIYYILLAVD